MRARERGWESKKIGDRGAARRCENVQYLSKFNKISRLRYMYVCVCVCTIGKRRRVRKKRGEGAIDLSEIVLVLSDSERRERHFRR